MRLGFLGGERVGLAHTHTHTHTPPPFNFHPVRILKQQGTFYIQYAIDVIINTTLLYQSRCVIEL